MGAWAWVVGCESRGSRANKRKGLGLLADVLSELLGDLCGGQEEKVTHCLNALEYSEEFTQCVAVRQASCDTSDICTTMQQSSFARNMFGTSCIVMESGK